MLFGCSDDRVGSAPAERLDGQWARDDTIHVCLRLLAFTASNGVLVNQRICELTDGTLGAELHVSSFEADPDSITVYPEESSCADVSSEPHVLWYQLSGGMLTLGMPEGAVVYERNRESRDGSDDGQRGAAVTFGCFDDDGLFTPRAVQPI
jgi:hypothetical protein